MAQSGKKQRIAKIVKIGLERIDGRISHDEMMIRIREINDPQMPLGLGAATEAPKR